MSDNQPALQQVKALIGIKDNSKDSQIEAILPEVMIYLDDYSGWTNLTIAKMVEYHLNHKAGYTSESLSRHSASFETEYPPSITRGLRRKL